MAIYSKSVEGLDELIAAFMKLPEDALKYMKDASNEAGAVVLGATKQRVPERTGKLKGALKLGKARKSGKYPYRVFSKVTFPSSAAYAAPLELGHKIVVNGKVVGAVTERPFMRPAADESAGAVEKIMIDAMTKALEQMGGMK